MYSSNFRRRTEASRTRGTLTVEKLYRLPNTAITTTDPENRFSSRSKRYIFPSEKPACLGFGRLLLSRTVHGSRRYETLLLIYVTFEVHTAQFTVTLLTISCCAVETLDSVATAARRSCAESLYRQLRDEGPRTFQNI